MLDYATMVADHPANWDSPPGTGYLSVAGIGAAALASWVLGRLATPLPWNSQRPTVRQPAPTSVG